MTTTNDEPLTPAVPTVDDEEIFALKLRQQLRALGYTIHADAPVIDSKGAVCLKIRDQWIVAFVNTNPSGGLTSISLIRAEDLIRESEKTVNAICNSGDLDYLLERGVEIQESETDLMDDSPQQSSSYLN